MTRSKWKIAGFGLGLWLLFVLPGWAQTIEFGQEISLQSDHGLFLVAEDDGRLNANRVEAQAWERFRLERVGGGADSRLRFGDQIALRSTHGKYVVAESNGDANADRDVRSFWETWRLVDPLEPGSTDLVHPRDAVSLRSHHGDFLVAESDGRANANRSQIGPWERWRIGLTWTDFYYDQAAACPSGACCPCPYRGRFDGANCFVAKPPVGATPRLNNGEFVYQASGGVCPVGSRDGGRCRVGDNPDAPRPFLYQGGFYLSSLCSGTGALSVQVDRVAHCLLPGLCSQRLTRDEFRHWPNQGVPNPIQRNTQIGVVFGPGTPARRVALLFAGQQFDQPLEVGSRSLLTGQRNGFKDGWSFRQASRRFELDVRSVAHRLVEEEILDPRDSVLAVAFDARFNHKFTSDNKQRIENAYYQWLRSKFDPGQVEFVYLAGYSRGGCLAMRLARRLQEELPHVQIVGQSFDGVCNRNQGELGIEIPGRVRNPVSTLAGQSAHGWPTDLREEFQDQESSLALLHVVGGYPFLTGDLAVRAFSQKRADQERLDLCWYQQQWVDLDHGALGGTASVQPALDHLTASLDRFANGPACPPVGGCAKRANFLRPFECNDLVPVDCAEQTECSSSARCRHRSGSLTCRDLSSRSECERYDEYCRWRTRGRDRCVRRLLVLEPFECNDLTIADCRNHGECRVEQECRRVTGSLTCGDLFTRESCERYADRGCRWR